MDSVRLQIERIHELQDYIDAQSGGPGKGWFRIVDDPFEARQVINEGKLAVILGIEVSEPFGCGVVNGAPAVRPRPTSTAGSTRSDGLGVRQLEIVNKFDNALAGVAGDGGATGTVVNGGNFYEHRPVLGPGDLRPTPRTTTTPPTGGRAQRRPRSSATRSTPSCRPALLPDLPGAPHCNTRGLTDLGEHARAGG